MGAALVLALLSYSMTIFMTRTLASSTTQPGVERSGSGAGYLRKPVANPNEFLVAQVRHSGSVEPIFSGLRNVYVDSMSYAEGCAPRRERLFFAGEPRSLQGCRMR